MKQKFLLGAVVVTMLASCNLSPETKANHLIKKAMKMSLYQADTYDPVSTQLDSAFTPFDDPAFYDKALKACKLTQKITEYQSEMELTRTQMSIFDDPYSAFSRNEYSTAKEKHDKLLAKKTEAENKLKQYAAELKTAMEKKPQFIGFKATHSYRADNNAGQTVFGETVFLFDKDISQIVKAYDCDKSDYKNVQLLYKYMRGEDILTEDEGTSSIEGLEL